MLSGSVFGLASMAIIISLDGFNLHVSTCTTQCFQGTYSPDCTSKSTTRNKLCTVHVVPVQPLAPRSLDEREMAVFPS